MKHLLTFLTFCNLLFSSATTNAQCTCSFNAGSNGQYPSGTLTPSSSWTSLNDVYGGDYALFYVTNGSTYTWSYCSLDGGSATWDTRLNLYRESNSNYITCSGDYDVSTCGSAAKIVWTANFTGVVRLITNVYYSSANPCGVNSTGAKLRYKVSSQALPDLIIEEFPSITPQSVVAGGSVTVSFKVINQGNASANATTTSFHISSKSWYDNTASWVADYSTPSLSAKSNTGTVSKTFNIPSGTSPGNYYILVSADGTLSVSESNENNQTTYVAITVTQTPQVGGLQVTLSPQSAITNGAQWRVDGGNWRNSGYTQSNLSVGSHALDFKAVSGYTTPQSKNVSITANNTTNESGTYTSNTAAQISSNTTSIDFTNVCASTTKNFTITNTGNADLVIQVPSNVPQHYSVGHYNTTNWTQPVAITPGSSLIFTVNFSPPGNGTFNGFFTLISNANNTSSLNINLTAICDANISVIGDVNPSTGYVGDLFTFSANVVGNTGNLDIYVELTNPVTNLVQPLVKMNKLDDTHYELSITLSAIGQYKYRISIPNITASQYYTSPITAVRPPVDDYPRDFFFNVNCKVPPPKIDPWGFEGNTCTSWVAWKINQGNGITDLNLSQTKYPFYNDMLGGHFGNASHWKQNAIELNNMHNNIYPVNQSPAVGAVAWFGPNEAGDSSSGHVAYVVSYNQTTTELVMTEYNFSPCKFDKPRAVYLNLPGGPGNRKPSWFIHVEGGAGGSGGVTSIGSVLNSMSNMEIFPNPSTGIFNLTFYSEKNDQVEIFLVDFMGKVLHQDQLETQQGKNTKEFNFGTLPNGIYVIGVKNQTGIVQKRIIIQH